MSFGGAPTRGLSALSSRARKVALSVLYLRVPIQTTRCACVEGSEETENVRSKAMKRPGNGAIRHWVRGSTTLNIS